MTTATYTVSGMTCEHCVRAVFGDAGRPGMKMVTNSLRLRRFRGSHG